MFRGMLAFPYVTAESKVVNIRFRSFRGEERKMLWPTGTHPGPYNLKAVVSDAKTVVICEGETDTLTLAELGIAAVGIPGVHLWKPYYARLFDGARSVIVWGDPDEPGRKFNAEIQKSIPRATAAYMEKDINDTYVQDGFLPIMDAYEKAGGML